MGILSAQTNMASRLCPWSGRLVATPRYYLGNAKILREAVEGLGFKVHGGKDAPYIFMDLEGKSSWDVFEEILTKANVVTIPGAGFGPGGEGFLRLSAFASRENCVKAAERLTKLYG